MSSLTTAAWFSAAAHISAVSPRHASRAPTLAPEASSILTASTLPDLEAVIRGVSPSPYEALGSAPDFRSAAIIATLATVQASCSGVTPYRLAALAFAPAPSSTPHVS